MDDLQEKVDRLEKRVELLERHLFSRAGSNNMPVQHRKELKEATGRENLNANLENLLGSYHFGWLAIIVILISVAFFLRFMFLKDYISGWAQPITLAILGIVLTGTGDYLRAKSFRKFGAGLMIIGITILFTL